MLVKLRLVCFSDWRIQEFHARLTIHDVLATVLLERIEVFLSKRFPMI